MNITIIANELIPGKLYKANKDIYQLLTLKTLIEKNDVFMVISQHYKDNWLFVGPVEGLEIYTTHILLNNKILKVKTRGPVNHFAIPL